MSVTMKDVRDILDAEELDYPKAARQLGADALPHLRTLIQGGDPMLASKAAYLTGLIPHPDAAVVLAEAARSQEPRVRLAAASTAPNLPQRGAEDVLLALLDDVDSGVRRIAVNSAPNVPTPRLKTRLEALRQREQSPTIRRLAEDALQRFADEP